MTSYKIDIVQEVIELTQRRLALPDQAASLATRAGQLFREIDQHRWESFDEYALCEHACAELIHGDFEGSTPATEEYQCVLQALQCALDGRLFSRVWE